MPEARRGIGRGFLIRGSMRDFGPALVEFVVNGSLELGRGRVNGFSQCKSVVADGDRLLSAHVSFHPAAHVASAQGMVDLPTQMNFHEGDPIDIPIQ